MVSNPKLFIFKFSIGTPLGGKEWLEVSINGAGNDVPQRGAWSIFAVSLLNLQEGFVVLSHRLDPSGLKQKGDLLEGGVDLPRRRVKLQNRASSREVQGTPATWSDQ